MPARSHCQTKARSPARHGRQERRPASVSVQRVQEEHEAEPHEAEGPRPHVVREERRHRHEGGADQDRGDGGRPREALRTWRPRARGRDRPPVRAAVSNIAGADRGERPRVRNRRHPGVLGHAEVRPVAEPQRCSPRREARAEWTRSPSARPPGAGRGGGSGPRAGGPGVRQQDVGRPHDRREPAGQERDLPGEQRLVPQEDERSEPAMPCHRLLYILGVCRS